MRKNKLYIVVPCYNEEEVLNQSADIFKTKLNDLKRQKLISEASRIVFVNDGSKDSTWHIISNLHEGDPETFSGISLSRNRGHQHALLGGLMTVKDVSDLTISIDADLQDDINAIDEMIKKYHEGSEIVYGVRGKRSTDSLFKRFTAEGFYKLMNWMGAKVIFNHADFRLMSRRAIEELEKFSEVNLFLRGLVPLIGLESDVVEYERLERMAGESKYPLRKMMSFAFEGITSFSVRPIKLVTTVGVGMMVIAIAIFVYSVAKYLMGETVQGWTSILVSIWLVGGMMLFSLGIVGEYVGKIYLEVKGRPRYIVENFLNKDTNK